MSSISTTNFFEIFGFVPTFNIDQTLLEQNFRRLQADVHPDRFAAATEAEKRQALQQSSLLNDGYRTLKHAISRAECLITLSGGEIGSQVSPTFLIEQMEWREAIETARKNSDLEALEALYTRLQQTINAQERALAISLEGEVDYLVASEQVNELRFYEKLRVEIDNALDALEY
jgi:molecular chaperone HscB